MLLNVWRADLVDSDQLAVGSALFPPAPIKTYNMMLLPLSGLECEDLVRQNKRMCTPTPS